MREAAAELDCTPEEVKGIEVTIADEAAGIQRKCKESGWRIETDDLVMAGWEAVAAGWEKISASDNRGAYIRTTARNAMKRYCRRLKADALGGAVGLESVRMDL
jgi:DNA-directed RNA polymerase specialized sigma24 family protein